jgi:hypothetical protein
MKTKYTLFRRGEVFYIQDSATGKQTSLKTKDETEAKSLLNARNEAQRQPVLNLHLARAYLITPHLSLSCPMHAVNKPECVQKMSPPLVKQAAYGETRAASLLPIIGREPHPASHRFRVFRMVRG